jgi:IclR family acetate operon transcriptional repressor
VFRLLKTLLATGFAVQREDRRTYVLSRKILELSAPRSGDKSLVLASHEALRWLRDETGETVQLVIEAEGKSLVLEQFRGTHPLQVNGEVGMRVPLYSCAPGKAILAGWSESRREEWYKGPGRKRRRFTETTLHRRDELEREFARIRENGFAIDRAEGIEGIHCVAALICDAYGQPLGAVTVMAPSVRMGESDFDSLAILCRKAVNQIEEGLKQ